MDNWNYLIAYKKDLGEVSIQYRRTNNAFCQNLIHNNKNVGRIYIFGLKEIDNNIHGYVARVHLNTQFRKNGYAIQMMSDVIKNFGHCVLHITSASPNRIEDLSDENREMYRNKLYKFYGRFGFVRTSVEHTGMVRNKN
jgi:ribosomal protein S17E